MSHRLGTPSEHVIFHYYAQLPKFGVAKIVHRLGGRSTGGEVEHIVQDSCSDDGTQDWLPQDSRVKAFIEKDSGM